MVGNHCRFGVIYNCQLGIPMSDVRKALEAAVDAVSWHDLDDDWEDIVCVAVLAFLRAMPDASRFSDIMMDGEKAGEIRLPNVPSTLIAAIEKETP